MPVSVNKLIPYITLIIACLAVQSGFATHNRAGEITYEQIDDFTVRATITTYTKNSSEPADRDSLEIDWGDGIIETVVRTNGEIINGIGTGVSIGNDTRYNLYTATHTYPSQDRFVISMTDPNRNGGILNVNPPSSDNVPFHLSTTVTLFDTFIDGFNNSPILLQPPIDIGCVGQPFIHNPNAYDPDGDSLSYHMIIPLQEIGANVPNYSFPSQVAPGPDNNFFLNNTTGDFYWDSPQMAGEYNIAIIIVQHRNGNPIDTLIRDMQILIETCDNLPPEVEAPDEICVVAGELIEFDVVATAPIEEDQQVQLTALGSPFLIADPAVWTVEEGFQEQPLTGKFKWQTTCNHIADNFYSVVFKVVDSGSPVMLFNLKTVRIKVVGPPPEDVQALASNEFIEVTWENPYDCENADDDYFFDFSVWRREGSNQFVVDSCVTGLAGQGYQKIEFDITMDVVNNRYYYKDNDVERGRTYCYRILGEFAKLSQGGFPFNLVESLPSEEICVQLNRDIPLITNVSVIETDGQNGEMEVRWSKPNADDLDTLLNPGPYVYKLFRAPGFVASGSPLPDEVGTWSAPTFAEAIDTVFIDTNLNTRDNPYTYQLAFYVNNESEPLGYTNLASSVYLNIISTDEENILQWEEMIPWDNFEYTIFKENTSGGFDSIDVTTALEYSDKGLVNGEEYCYYVRSKGSYGVGGILSPLYNNSQENCGIPLDSIPPCPPVLEVRNICDNPESIDENLINTLIWTNPNVTCEETDDVVSYNIFYSPIMGEELSLIGTVDGAENITMMHQPDLGIAGCYAVSAVDSIGNISDLSNVVCVDNCPLYTLPNVFTPNGDNANELFTPINYRFIDRIEIKVFNKWGNLVFETMDPEINWNGTNLSGADLAEGVYFYNCKVFEKRVSGVVENPELLSGFIELIRGN